MIADSALSRYSGPTTLGACSFSVESGKNVSASWVCCWSFYGTWVSISESFLIGRSWRLLRRDRCSGAIKFVYYSTFGSWSGIFRVPDFFNSAVLSVGFAWALPLCNPTSVRSTSRVKFSLSFKPTLTMVSSLADNKSVSPCSMFLMRDVWVSMALRSRENRNSIEVNSVVPSCGWDRGDGSLD